jgi:prolyl oligopeptidase PreP (S9A serine peptidase family)
MAPDGTRVPLSLVHRSDLQPTAPIRRSCTATARTVLRQTPFFQPTFMPWFDHGGVLAIAHVRGKVNTARTVAKQASRRQSPTRRYHCMRKG